MESVITKDESDADKTVENEISEIIAQRMPSVVYIAILIAIGVFGNANVLFIFTKFFRQSTYRVFVRTLACVDLLVCVTHMPLEILYLLKPFGFYSEGVCKTYRYFVYFLNYLSILLLVIIAVERYIRICTSLSGWRMSTKISNICSLIAAAIALVLAIPGVFTNGQHIVYIGNHTLVACEMDDENYETGLVIIYFAAVGIAYMVSTFVLVFAYTSIVRTIRNRQKNCVLEQPTVSSLANNLTRMSESTNELHLHVHQNNPESQIHLERTTRTLTIITAIFVIVHAPYFCLCITVSLDTSIKDNLEGVKLAMYEIGLRLYLINNVVNPMVYGFTDFRFQRACRSLYRKGQCKRQIGHGH
ncbi:cholecystokinin A receptor [Mytilus galloprovincialis]|uniref:Cholecystokinin A receptor n=1 Tax=Mytilus galloprovincialis TaxID=29158 RepID=A0A8B6DHS1_MYTGA|nr:cholecystokinin A receptor [Mytilus galloprovincialis]